MQGETRGSRSPQLLLIMSAEQRQILTQMLDRIPAHPAAHGFVKTRSIKTFATPHVGQRVLLRLDLDKRTAAPVAG